MAGELTKLRMPVRGVPKVPMGGFRSLQPAAPTVFHWPRMSSEDLEKAKEVIPGTEHFHWGITAFSEVTPEGNFADAVTVEVEGASEYEAIIRAQLIIERPDYRVSWVREACSIDPTLRDANKE